MAVMTSTCKGPESRAEVSPDTAEPKLKLSAWKAEALLIEIKQTLEEKQKMPQTQKSQWKLYDQPEFFSRKSEELSTLLGHLSLLSYTVQHCCQLRGLEASC